MTYAPISEEALRLALIDGEQSGIAVPFSMKDILEEARRESEADLRYTKPLP